MVESEREDAERTVGFVRSGMRQWRAPKIIEHQVDPRRRRVHIRIGLDRAAVGIKIQSVNYWMRVLKSSFDLTVDRGI